MLYEINALPYTFTATAAASTYFSLFVGATTVAVLSLAALIFVIVRGQQQLEAYRAIRIDTGDSEMMEPTEAGATANE